MVEEENRDWLRLGSATKHIPQSNLNEQEITEKPESKCVLEHASYKFKKQQDFKALFSGGTGTGKSYAGLRLLELHYLQKFKEEMPMSHIVSDLGEAVLRAKDFKRKQEGLLIEEISTSAGSRDSNTILNKQWNRFLDTVRIKQIFLIMNAPHITFVDKHIRMSLDCWIDCKNVDFSKKIVICKPLWLQTSPHKSEPYKHKYTSDAGDEIDFCFFRKPSDYILEIYDKQKQDFTFELYDDIAMKMAFDREKKLKELGAKFLPRREAEAYILWLKGVLPRDGAKEMGLSRLDIFSKYLLSAKNKMKRPEYAKQLRIFNQNPQNNTKTKETHTT